MKVSWQERYRYDTREMGLLFWGRCKRRLFLDVDAFIVCGGFC